MLWSEREVDIMLRYYESEGYKIMRRLPGRSMKSVYEKAAAMGMSKDNPLVLGEVWSEDELATLKNNYQSLGAEGVAMLLPDRTLMAIYHKAGQFGLVSQKVLDRKRECLPGPYRKHWSEEEMKTLRENYAELGSAVFSMIPGRTRSAVHYKAKTMGLHYKGRKTDG